MANVLIDETAADEAEIPSDAFEVIVFVNIGTNTATPKGAVKSRNIP